MSQISVLYANMRAYIRQFAHLHSRSITHAHITSHRAVAVVEQARITHPGFRQVEDLPAAKLVVHDLQAFQFKRGGCKVELFVSECVLVRLCRL